MTNFWAWVVYISCTPTIDREPLAVLSTFPTHFLIVRADLPIGSQAAQIGHAAGESVPAGMAPLPEGTVVVALHVDDEVELMEYHLKLKAAGLRHKLIIESDGHAMAIGLEPTYDRPSVKKVLSKLRLVR